jgi:protein involved in polysaccharide export with SLBB domain
VTLKHLLLPLALLLPVVASAQSISQAQIEQFRQLPEAQQKALARQYGIDLSSLKSDNSVGKRPETVNVVDPVDQNEDSKNTRSSDQSAEKGDQSRNSDELKPYGYDLFAGSPTTFAPVTEIPVPARYTLGPGDVLNIQLWGKENQSLQLPVSRDGTISFPQSGPMSVAGLTFDQARQKIRKQVSEQYIGVEASVSLGELRSMRVFVLGEARNPGSYTVSSLATMTNTLYVAGGIKKSGSLRRVQHKRDGKVVGTLDLYQLLLHGDNSGDDRLQPGDVIFIPPVGKRVGIEGEVNRPALYELKGKTSIADLIALAGGLTSQAYPGRINIERTNKDFLRIIAEADFTRPEGRTAPVQAGDLIHVPSIADVTGQYVEVKGAATHTGKFAWVPGMRVSSLIRNLDSDLLPIADKNYAAIVRTDPTNDTISVLNLRLRKALANPGGPKDLTLSEKDRLLFFSDGGKVDVASEGTDQATVTPGRSDEPQENTLPAYTRSVLFEPVLQRLKAQASPGQPQQIISISGPVRYPGDYPMPATHRLADALFIAGGLKDSASLMRAEVARHTTDESGVEKTTIFTVDLADAMTGDSDLALRSRDRILIKSIPDFAKTRTVELKGEVRYPGVYTFRDGETLKGVLARAGGLTENAFPKGAVKAPPAGSSTSA